MQSRVLLCLAFVTGSASAQSLSDLFYSALQTDPVRAGDAAQFEASKERVTEARAAVLPAVGVVANASRSRFDAASVNRYQEYHSERYGVQITQSLFRPAQVVAIDEAKTQRDAASAKLDTGEADLLLKVIAAYFEALIARENKVATARQMKATLQQLNSAQRSFDVGTASITDVRDAEAKHDVVVAQLAGAENDLLLKKEAIKQLTGVDEIDLRILQPDLAGPEETSTSIGWLIDEAIDQNPVIQQAKLELISARQEISKAKTGRLPTLDLTMSYGNDETTGTPTTPIPVHGRTAVAEASLNIPLFSGFSVNAKIREAIALEAKANADLTAAQQSIKTSIREAFYGLRTALIQIVSLKSAVRSSSAAVRANRKGYRVGSNSTADVLNAESQYFQTYRDLCKAKLDAWQNHIKLQVITGAPWRNGVDAFDRLLVIEPSGSSDELPADWLTDSNKNLPGQQKRDPIENRRQPIMLPDDGKSLPQARFEPLVSAMKLTEAIAIQSNPGNQRRN